MADWTALDPGQAVTRWAMAAPREAPFPGAARPMPDTVTYRFVNGWVATGDLPCREALLAALPTRDILCPTGPFDDLVVGFDGAELDFSRFCHRPTLVAQGFTCLVRGGPARVRLGTCGGVRLWLDGRPVAVFEPFKRNRPHHTEITLPLSGATQALTLRLEDLHERDTTNFFSLVLLEGEGVETALPAGFDTEDVARTADVLANLRTDRVFHQDGQDLRLVADMPPSQDLPLHIADLGPFGRGGLVSDPMGARPVDMVLTPDAPAATLGPATGFGAGCLSLKVETRVGRARLQRQLGTTALREGTPLSGDWPDRQAGVAALIAEHGGFEASVALCQAATGRVSETTARIIAASLDTIETRMDCSDFTILPLLRLYRDHRDALPTALAGRMKAAFLGYRYWLDEPGNDVMWFWSENHVLCFHTAQLVAGQLFPDAVFLTSGRTGADQARLATTRLTRWFDAIEEDGLCEWNSAAYYPIDMLGLLTLHDMAPAFRARAARVLDRVLVMSALHTTGGVPAGSQGRCYEKELLAGPHTELGSVMAMVLSGEFVPGHDRAAGLLALSGYVPPEVAPLAAPAPGRYLHAAYTQGHCHAGKLTLWKSAECQLSTVRPHAPGTEGHQAQCLDVQLARHPMARLWVNHPGEARVWGERRPSLLAGNHVTPAVAQEGPVGLMVYDLRRDWTDLRYTQLFADPQAFGPPEWHEDWLIFAGTVAAWCSTRPEVETSGLYRGALWRARAERAGWCIAMRLPDETPEAFVARLATLAPCCDGTSLTVALPDAFALHADGSVTRNGTDQPFAPLSTTPHCAWDDDPLTAWERPLD